jgi:shikimate dehydrogenase
MHNTHHVCLIGWPVEHSVSPAMHNAAFGALDLPWRYTLLPAPPGEVRAALARLKAQGYRGANVTVPHKQAVMPHLDEIAGAARAVGAVNTIVARRGRLVGHNTDAGGFLAALREGGFEPAGKHALVLGAGGAARAVIYALTQTGCAVAVHNRTARRAAELIRTLDVPARLVDDLAEIESEAFDLLVNATSVGMAPHVDASPWPAALPLPARWTVYDLVYNPAETRLLARARAAGATAIGGLGMLVHQGALAFELWTGHPPPVEVMRAAAQNALRGEPSCYDS